jgi:hypothetical protein
MPPLHIPQRDNHRDRVDRMERIDPESDTDRDSFDVHIYGGGCDEEMDERPFSGPRDVDDYGNESDEFPAYIQATDVVAPLPQLPTQPLTIRKRPLPRPLPPIPKQAKGES